jgi:hypothetical protein
MLGSLSRQASIDVDNSSETRERHRNNRSNGKIQLDSRLRAHDDHWQDRGDSIPQGRVALDFRPKSLMRTASGRNMPECKKHGYGRLEDRFGWDGSGSRARGKVRMSVEGT